MATPHKDGKVWRVQINKLGVRDSGSFPTKAAANDWITKREGEIKDGKTGKAPAGTTLADALNRYVAEVSIKKKGEKWETNKVAAIIRDFPTLAGVQLANLGVKDFKAWRDQRLKDVVEATVLREWTLLTHCLKIAKNEWHWLAENPLEELERPEDGEARIRLPTDDEITRLQAALGYNPDVAPASKTQRVGWAMMFAAETAMRAGEIIKLTWVNVLPEQRIARLPIIREGKFKGKADTKTGAARDVPLSSRALEILEVLRTVRSPDGESVFELTSASRDKLFRVAKEKCAIEDLHFHDFRAYALTRLAKKVDVLTLARISGHKDINELMVYYRTTPTDIALMLD